MTYLNGVMHTCQLNMDCQKDEFCDMKPNPATDNGHGICCSMPTGCGGEAVKLETGLKICRKEADCSLKDGEICSWKFPKVANSLWKTDEGVCCKMTCKPSTEPGVEPASPPAGHLCGKGTCSSDGNAFRTCEDTLDTGEKRCCEYKRQPGLCPATTTDGFALNGNSKAITCTAAMQCPDKDHECPNRFCCKGQFIPVSLPRKGPFQLRNARMWAFD